MYKKLLVLVLVLVSACTSEKYIWYSGSLEEALELISASRKKLVMLDFYSDG